VKNLIREGGFAPEEILVMTFSRKAADEIKERVRQGIGESARNILTGTFHSFCLRFLKEHADIFMESFGFTTFPEVADESTGSRLYREIILRKLPALKGMPVDVALDLIRGFETLDKDIVKRLAESGLKKVLEEIINEYRDLKVFRNMVDFGDMILYATELLEKRPNLRRAVSKRIRYLVIDEFQDTSCDNFRLLKALLPEQDPNLFAVGDDYQSIYGFRNARVEYIINMKNYFPGVKLHKLTTNYRSRGEIVKLSNRFIRKNRKRTKKRLVSFKGRGGLVTVHETASDEDQVEIIKDIMEKVCEEGKTLAVLCRNNWQIDHITGTISPRYREKDNIHLMTIHGSKGLEFDTVIVAGISDRIIPDRTNCLEEERRLFYVALTRAEEKLYILYRKEGREKPRFIRELGTRV
jgi:DNA helicase-2/ATP-dependent DNA helicase PcrA